MNRCKYYMIGFFILFSTIPYVWSLKCWDCRSSYDPKCADPFDNRTLPITDCEEQKRYSHLTEDRPSMCQKILQKVDGQLVTIRGCTWKRQDDYSTMCTSNSNEPNEVASFCETCNYDGCNGAAIIGTTVALIIAPFALLLLN